MKGQNGEKIWKGTVITIHSAYGDFQPLCDNFHLQAIMCAIRMMLHTTTIHDACTHFYNYYCTLRE